jgi:hypothetical protein
MIVVRLMLVAFNGYVVLPALTFCYAVATGL